MYGIGALLLVAALAWGVYQSRTRNRRNDRVTEQAVKAEYQNPDTYRQKSEDLKRKVEPS
jgi:hypothetical protein